MDANTTVHTWQNKAFAVPTDEASILSGQSKLGSHGYFPSDLHVTLRQAGIFVDNLLGEAEEGVDALQGYLLCDVHFQLRLSRMLCLHDVSDFLSDASS